jgi:ABC-type uncharacterized transport system substrate-binding protein
MASLTDFLGIQGKHLAGVLLGLGMVLPSLNVFAATVAVILSDDSAPYLEFLGAFRTEIGKEHSIIQLAASQTSVLELPPSTSLIVTVGVKAAESIGKYSTKPPVIAALVPRDWFLHGGQAQLALNQRSVSALYLDQPLSRQLQLIKIALPKASRLGVVLGASQSWMLREVQSQARQFQINVSEAVLGPNQRLVESLDKVLPEADLLLAVPDPDVFNRTTAQTLFLTTYRYRVPVVGYSQSLTRAGALISIYSTPAQIGRHAGELVLKSLSGNNVKLPPAQFPDYFTISTNPHVARSLDIDLPEETVLQKRMQDANNAE